jgi:hypothetical protein
MKTRGHVTDARQRRVTQLDPVGMHLLRRHNVIPAHVLRTIAAEPGLAVTTWERATLAFGIALPLLVAGLFIHAIVTGDFAGGPLARSAAFAYFSFVPLVIWYGLKAARFGKIAAAMLKHRRCPHCGYDLGGLEPDDADGATVCPECGCAWHMTVS